MGIKNKLENVYYEIIAPEKQELFNNAEIIDKKIDNNSSLQKSIDKLKRKIEISQTGKQREILEEQLEELEKLYELYQKSKKINLTKTTQKQINELFSGIEQQINLNNNEITDDTQLIKKILIDEEDKLEDTIDIIDYGTIRDQFEDYIDILNIKESISPQKYQDFFDIATIEYINILEARIKRKLNENEIKYILKQKGLLLSKKEIQIFSENINKKLPKNYNFKYKIKLYNGSHIELDTKIKTETKTKEIDINQLFKETNIHENKPETIKRKTKFDNYEKLSTGEKMKIIENILSNPKNEKFLLAVINKLENKIISVDHKKIKLTKEFINKHKKELLNNLKVMILMIIHIESDGNYKVRNYQKSSAKGLGQWLDGNGGYSKEYMYKNKWYTKNQLKRKFNKTNIKDLKTRTVWNTSSFETTLRGIYYGYQNELLNKLSFNIPKKYNKHIKLSPTNLNLEQQIQLLILDIGINGKTVKNGLGQKVGIKDFMGTALLGNSWAVKEIYKIFHHTKPDKKTLNRIKNISPKYTKKLIKLY